GRTVEYGYDRMGRAVTVTNTLGYTTAAQYDSLGRRTATIDANGHSTTFTYDALGRVIQVTNGAGYTTTYVYDALGRQTTLYNGLGQPTYLGYDALGRTTLITNALQHAVETTYDGAGRKTAVEDANGVVTRYAYDPRAQLIQVIENYVSGSASDRQTNVTTQYAYDLAGNRTAFADALSHTTVYTYDVLGQLTATSDPLGHTSVYTYDVRGLRSAEMDPEARTTTYTYDARDRLTQRANADETVSYAYDVLGQRTAMTDTTGATRYDYDDLGRVLTVTYPSGDAVGYRYDRAGNRTQLIYPDGKTVAYAYNAANWLSTVTDWNSDVTTYTYNAAGMLVGVERPNGIQTAYSYDDAGRLAVLRHTQGSDLLAVYTYTLDAAGNRTHVIEQVRQPVEGGLAQGGTAEDVLAAYGLGQENSDQDELPPDQAGRSPLSMDAGRHWLASPTAWSGNRQIEPAGPPALVSVAVEPSQLPADGESQAVVLVYVTDADGLPVQDGTPVAVKTTAGWLSAEEGQTERGLLRLTLTAPDRPVEGTITALVGELKGEATIQFVQASGLALNVSGQSDKSTGGELRPGLEIAEVMERLRNPLREDGQGGWQVKNAHYQATFDQTGVAFALQGQDRAEKDAPEGKDASADEGQLPALHVRLERVRLGETVLYDAAGEKAQAMPSVTGNQAIFQHWPGFEENYRAGDGVLQQTFTLAELPDVDLSAAGDLVVEVVVETDLQARLMSKRQGILFSRAGNESAPLLAYSGALVRDAGGQEMLADLKLDDAVEIYRSQKPGYRLSIVVPGAWLAEAEFPLVIDPLIGDPFLASDPRPQQKELAVAYNPAQDEYLVVWCGYDTGGADCDLQAQRVLSDGIKVGSVITIAQAAGEQREPAVAYNSDNQEYLVVWNDTRNDADGDIYAQRLSITGTLLGSAVVVAETALEEGHPALAYNPVDDVYLAVWHMYIGDDYDIVGRLISASGTLSGTAFAVDDSWQWDLRPDVTYNGSAGAAGEFLVVWDRGWDRIYGQRLSGLGVQLDNSGTAGNEALSDVAFLINDAASDQVYARLAANGETGTYLVVWTDYRSGYSDIYGQMISPTGTLSGTELAIVTNGDDQDTPDVAYNTVRQVYLVGWNNAGDWDVYGQRVTAGGALTGSAVNLSNANGSQFDAALAYNDDNDEWLVVWQDWRWDTLVVYGQRVSGSGSLSGTAFAIGPYVLDAYRPWVAYNEATQEYLVVWEDYRNGNADVYGQRMTQAGMPSGDNFRISSSSAAGDQTAPRVASGGANGYLVVWTDYRSDGSGDVYGQVVSTTGALSGTNFSIVTHSDVQAAPSVAYGAQRGEYLVVWEDYRGSSYDIYGRRVTAGGALSGSEIAVTTVTYAQRYPALAYNGDRDAFVAVWSDKKYSAAHDYDVYGQVVSASGSLSGTVYAVFGTTGTQYRPSIAYWSGGVYWVLWRDGRDYATNNYDIYGRTLNGSGAPSGTVVALAATSGAQDLPVVAPLAGSDAGFFALWADYRDEDEADLYGQRLNSDGTLRGGNLLLLDGWGYPSGLSLAAHTAQPEALFVWDWWGDIVAQRYGLLVADFAASPVSGGVPLTVTFTNTSTPTAGITGYLWNFGDGVTSTITNPVHCYTPTGVYTVSLTVSGAGETETLTRTNYITVGIVPQSPVADFSATPTSGNAPLTATFTNTSTNATSYEWNFGDGVTSTLENPTHTYTQADVYTVSLAATGPGGMDVLTRTGYITVTDGAAYTVTTRTITYTYDPLNRLTEAEYDDGTFYEYEYDAVGNRKAVTTTAGTVAYQYDAANRLTQVGGVSYTWDDAGNLLNDGLFTYTWDAAGRLVMAQNITHTVIYTYNGDGVRVAQNADGVETRWVQTLASHCTSYNRSSNSVCGLPQVLVETRGIESTLYVYGPSRLAQMKTDSTGWFLGDALGSVRQLVDDSGDVVLARDYDSYGQVMAESGTGESGYGFTGEQYDAATELLFLRARYYALGTGRFLSWDPWQGSIQQPSSLHKYLYTGDNPIKLVDPSGRQECEGRPGEPCHSVLKAWPTHLYERSTCWEKVGMHRCTGYYTPIEAELTDTEKVSLPVLDKRQSPDQLVNVVVPKRFYDRASIQGTGKLSQEGYEGLYLAMWKNPVEFTDRVWVSMKGGKPIAGKTAAINTGKSVHLALGDEIYLPEKSVRLQVNDNGTGDPTIADPRYWIDIYLGEGDAERNQVGSNLVGRNFTDYMVYKKTWNVFCEFPCPPPSELIVP
ncbi:MAG: PKD domain-containing protein, partial [Anaerolineae bacterium]|nr:PKD domain-containing protein [Anaerolineae bacterium]